MMGTLDKIMTLRKVALFRSLPFEDLAALSRIAEIEQFPEGALIFSENDSGDSLYVRAGSGGRWGTPVDRAGTRHGLATDPRPGRKPDRRRWPGPLAFHATNASRSARDRHL